MSSHAGSYLETLAKAVAARGKIPVRIGEPDATGRANEPGIFWTQPRERRYQYRTPRYQRSANATIIEGLDQWHASHDRFIAVTVRIQAPGSERRLLELSDAFLVAMDYELGAEGSQGENWEIDTDSSGDGSGALQSAWVEEMRILIKYQVIREKYAPAAEPIPIETAAIPDEPGGDPDFERSGLEVEGAAQGENVEAVL